MVRSLLIALALMVALATGGSASAQAPGSQRATDVAAADLQRLQGEQKTWIEAKRSLALRYKKQLAQIDALKRQRSGWRRNRELRSAYAETQATAKRLAAYDRRVRGYDRKLSRARSKLLAAANAELGGKPSARRARYLRSIRRSAQRQGGSKRRRIVLPNDRIDPLASAEELEEQAELLRRSEAQLAREIENLEAREKRLSRMAKLKRTRARASEMGALDVNNPRRTTGRTGTASTNNRGSGGGISSDAEADPAPGGQSPPPAEPGDSGDFNQGGGGEPAQTDYAVILADVVDTPTINAYRSADKSGNPTRKARATRSMRLKAQQRLRRLRAQRKRMLEAARRRKR